MRFKTRLKSLIVFSTVILLQLGHPALSQIKKPTEKMYPSILWEISGKGMRTPSYLFGTMHISNKMVFNLGDSFYHAIENCEMVGLELDPGFWQEHEAKKSGNGNPLNALSGFMGGVAGMQVNASLYKSVFAIDDYEKKLEYALGVEPLLINSLLYRKSEYNQEQEEDTYLDLYLYQICNKLSKKIVGLEQIDSSERSLRQATIALRDDKGNQSSRDYEDFSPVKLQDAYKKGDLDLLDSLERKATPNKKYRAIFIDHRNEIQAAGIDSVIKLGKSIFAGVGCAHLPGQKGVIEVLRKMGYRLRPVTMNRRNSTEKDRIDKLRFPVKFSARYTSDSIVKADIPGIWYHFANQQGILQYADLANGSYYMLDRVPTNALFHGQTPAQVLKKVDSLLYENIPGKIITRTSIVKNGYKGFDITNRTRRGDVQRYQILVTPFEVIMAKMSASGDYVLGGTEAASFFNSITIKPIEQTAPVHFMPSWGAFAIDLPHAPFIKYIERDNKQVPTEYSATDVQKNTHYLVMKETFFRSSFIEEDSFELNLLNESYMSSKVFDSLLSKRFVSQNGYPALEASYRLKDDNYAMARFVIQGPHYYAIIAQQKKPFTATPSPLTSFAIRPFVYPASRLQTDPTLGFSYLSPEAPPPEDSTGLLDEYMELLKENMAALEVMKSFRAAVLQNSNTGEMINVVGIKLPPYTYVKDSATAFNENLGNMGGTSEDTSYIVRSKTRFRLKDWDVQEAIVTDTNSSRQFHSKSFFRQGVYFSLFQYSDTLSPQSSFSHDVFTSFMPADSVRGVNIFERKSDLFFAEYQSKDSTTHARALSNLSGIEFAKPDVPRLVNAYNALTWEEPGYLGIKVRLIQALSSVADSAATQELNRMYNQAKDTALFQKSILAALIHQQTSASFHAFEELVIGNPPVDVNTSLDKKEDGIKDAADFMKDSRNSYDNDDDEWSSITDSMLLAKQIFPGLLTLMNLDDYKSRIEEIALDMADSGYASIADLQPFYTKLLLEAKHEYKKAVAQENTDNMKKKATVITVASKKSTTEENEETEDDDDEDEDTYSVLYDKLVLLTPFYDKQPAVKELFRQSFGLQSKVYRYRLFTLMARKNLAPRPDSLPLSFARETETRNNFYKFTQTIKQPELFPAAFATADKLAESKLFNSYGSKPDTFVLVETRPYQFRTAKGQMYFYKVKKKKGAAWSWSMVPMIADKKTGAWDMSYNELDDNTEQKVDLTKVTKEQIDTLLKEALLSHRTSSKAFYNYEENDPYHRFDASGYR